MDNIKMWLGVPGAEARVKAKKYGRLAEILMEKSREIQEYYEDAYNNLEASNTALMSNSDSAQGLILTDFNTHRDNWNMQYNRILNNITMGIQSLDMCIRTATQMQEYWNRTAEMEERKANGGF